LFWQRRKGATLLKNGRAELLGAVLNK